MTNILSQKKEIKRLEKTREKEEKEAEEERNRNEDEAKERAIQEFERVQMGLEAKVGSAAGRQIVGRGDGKIVVEEDVVGGKRGEKRKFELDEDELLRIAQEERTKARKAIDDEKVCVFSLVPLKTQTNAPSGFQDYFAFLLGTVNYAIIKYPLNITHHHKESQAIPRMPLITSRQAPLLFAAHLNHSRVHGGGGFYVENKSANLSILQEGLEQHFQSHACQALRSRSLQELCEQVHDPDRCP